MKCTHSSVDVMEKHIPAVVLPENLKRKSLKSGPAKIKKGFKMKPFLIILL